MFENSYFFNCLFLLSWFEQYLIDFLLFTSQLKAHLLLFLAHVSTNTHSSTFVGLTKSEIPFHFLSHTSLCLLCNFVLEMASFYMFKSFIIKRILRIRSICLNFLQRLTIYESFVMGYLIDDKLPVVPFKCTLLRFGFVFI